MNPKNIKDLILYAIILLLISYIYLHEDQCPIIEVENAEKSPNRKDQQFIQDWKNYGTDRILSTDDHQNEELERRLKSYQNFCKTKGSIDSKAYRYALQGQSIGNIHFSTCLIAKAASTSLTLAYLVATGFVRKPEIVSLSDLLSGDNRFSRSCNNVDNSCLVKMKIGNAPGPDDISVIFGREPMSRLVSAWKDKIFRTEDRDFYYERYTKEIIRTMLRKPAPATAVEAKKQGIKVDFKTFVSWIVKGNADRDEHWAPAHKICSVCGFDFNFIGHIETFKPDIESFYETVNVDVTFNQLTKGLNAVNPHSTSNGTKTPISDYFTDIDSETLKRLLQSYEGDYHAFGYPIPQFLQN